MTDPIDLLMLNMRGPLVDAVSATVCANWSEAADLWFDLCRRPQFAGLAARCGLEAALQAGEYDLAAYFQVGVSDPAALPELATGAWAEYLLVKSERKKYYSIIYLRNTDNEKFHSVENLVRLRLYKESIANILNGAEFARLSRESTALLAKCYFQLGFHDALLALNTVRARHLNAPEMKAMIECSGRMLKRRSEAPPVNMARFQERHPAGAALTALLESQRA